TATPLPFLIASKPALAFQSARLAPSPPALYCRSHDAMSLRIATRLAATVAQAPPAAPSASAASSPTPGRPKMNIYWRARYALATGTPASHAAPRWLTQAGGGP